MEGDQIKATANPPLYKSFCAAFFQKARNSFQHPSEPTSPQKLTRIIANNDIKSIRVVRMEVPCCGGIENAVKRALMASGKFIPWQIITVSTDGKILE